MKAKYKRGTVVELTNGSLSKIDGILINGLGVNYQTSQADDLTTFGEGDILQAYRPITVRKVSSGKAVVRGNRKGNSKKGLANAALANTESADVSQQ